MAGLNNLSLELSIHDENGQAYEIEITEDEFVEKELPTDIVCGGQFPFGMKLRVVRNYKSIPSTKKREYYIVTREDPNEIDTSKINYLSAPGPGRHLFLALPKSTLRVTVLDENKSVVSVLEIPSMELAPQVTFLKETCYEVTYLQFPRNDYGINGVCIRNLPDENPVFYSLSDVHIDTAFNHIYKRYNEGHWLI